MKITFRTRLYIGFTLAILLCAISGFTSYIIFQKQQTQRIWVRKARRVLDSTSSIQSLVINMETGRRGFRATNQKRFLEPYYNGVSRINPAMYELKNLLSGDPDLENSEVSLAAHINELLTFWANNGDNADRYTRDDLTRLTDSEKKQMDGIRNVITVLQKNETKQLTQRREAYDRLVHDGTLSSSIDSIVSGVIVIVLILIIHREFKSRRKVQEQLRQSVEQLKQKTEILETSESELKNALDELGKINKQLEKFVYTVAHDIKSPLSGIIGALTILHADELVSKNPELAELAELSSSAATHLSNMVNLLLEYSRTSITNQATEPVNTKELLEQIAILLFPPKNISIKIADEMPVFNTRKLKIVQVFQNLVSNAIKYNGKEKGLIEIGYTDKGDYYEFFVKDNGQGISENDKENIFALLATSKNKSTADSSTGFGLNIVKLIVEEQGGRIWYDSIPGQGSVFYFEWKK